MHELTIPLKIVVFFSQHVFVQSAGRATLQKTTNPHPLAVGMEAWLVFSWWVMAFALQSAKYLFFLDFNQIHCATLIEIG
jgi:hypothetical protein